MPVNRVLFVDGDRNLRLTFPAILRMHGFDVCVAATVAEALADISTHPYDILISDLNIGEAGDGFTLVSAMRRTQPDCMNFIITGFPAFESALAAIQRQVDGYLIKPASVEQLVGMIHEKILNSGPRNAIQPMRLSSLLRETVSEIRAITLAKMKANPTLCSFQMSDEERVGILANILTEIADQLESPEPNEPAILAIEASRALSLQRLSAGYKVSMLVTDSAILGSVVFDIVHRHLLQLDTSSLVLDLENFNLQLQFHLEQSIQVFHDAELDSGGIERKIGPSASPSSSGDCLRTG